MCRSTARFCGPLSMQLRARASSMVTSRHQQCRQILDIRRQADDLDRRVSLRIIEEGSHVSIQCPLFVTLQRHDVIAPLVDHLLGCLTPTVELIDRHGIPLKAGSNERRSTFTSLATTPWQASAKPSMNR